MFWVAGHFQCWSPWTGKQSMAECFLGPSSRRLCDQFRSCDAIWAGEWWQEPAPAQGAPLQLLMAGIISISNFRQDQIPLWQQISPNGSDKLTLFIALIIHSLNIYYLPVSEVLWTCSDVTFLVSSLLPTLFKITISCPIQHSLLSPLLCFSPYRVSDAALSKIRIKMCLLGFKTGDVFLSNFDGVGEQNPDCTRLGGWMDVEEMETVAECNSSGSLAGKEVRDG